MTTVTLAQDDLATFAAERDAELIALADLYRPGIAAALEEDDPQRLNLLLEALSAGFDAVAGDLNPDSPTRGRSNFLTDMREPLTRLEPDGSEAQLDRLATWFSTATIGAVSAATPAVGKTWVTMNDAEVRELHDDLHGTTVASGDPFMMGGVPTQYPGQPVGPIDHWINCRCVLSPALTASAPFSVSMIERVTAAADDFASAVLVAMPEGDGKVVYNDGGECPIHQTLAYLGTVDEITSEEEDALNELAAQLAESPAFAARVSGLGTLGDDQDSIVITEARELQEMRDAIEAHPVVGQVLARSDSHPTWISHVTGLDVNAGDEVNFDRIGLWLGGDRREFPMTSAVTAAADVPEVPEELLIPEDGNIPVHGVAVPEGVESGDGRKFAEGSLTHRDLPLPLTWQRASAPEHGGEVVVGRLDVLEKRGNLWHYEGVLLGDVPETEEVLGLIAQGALRGVSIAADSGQIEGFTDEQVKEALATGNEPTTVWNKARISGLTIVQIPAFQEGFIALGPDPESASVAAAAETEDFDRGPGWVTNPDDTRRLHDYWTKGEGAAKIRWGTNGDFTRCTRELRKYIEPRYLNRTCAQWHHDALGYWPGELGKPGNPPNTPENRRRAARHASLDQDCTDCEDTAMIAASAASHTHSLAADPITITAAAPMAEMPMDWLGDPALTQPTPLTVLASGQVFGHIAKWGTCHIGMGGQCIEPPRSQTDYAYYHLGEVETDGGRIACGSITLGTGHADLEQAFAGTKAHYDNTGTVVAKVRAGEDEHGIWVAGGLCEGVTDEQRRILMAAGGISGDWRKIGGNLELVAGLAVNVPGFPVPRPALAASAGGNMALVAAGVVAGNAVDIDGLADAVAELMAARSERRHRLERLHQAQRQERLAVLASALED